MSTITIYKGHNQHVIHDKKGRFMANLGKLEKLRNFNTFKEFVAYVNTNAQDLLDAWCFSGDVEKMVRANKLLNEKINREL